MAGDSVEWGVGQLGTGAGTVFGQLFGVEFGDRTDGRVAGEEGALPHHLTTSLFSSCHLSLAGEEFMQPFSATAPSPCPYAYYTYLGKNAMPAGMPPCLGLWGERGGSLLLGEGHPRAGVLGCFGRFCVLEFQLGPPATCQLRECCLPACHPRPALPT